MDGALSGSGGHSLVSVYFIYSVIVQLLFVILILLIVCSFTTFTPAHLPLRSVRLALECQCQPPPDFNQHETLAAVALADLQFWPHDIQTSLVIPRQKHLASSRSVDDGVR
jgi:hypothetical protein